MLREQIQRRFGCDFAERSATSKYAIFLRFAIVPRSCRADLGRIFYFGPASFRKIAGEFDSEFRVLQSGLGVNFLFWTGEFQEVSQRISIANLDGESFSLVFPAIQAPPPPQIHAQNSRPELSAFLSNFTFSNPKSTHADFLLMGETKICNRRQPVAGNWEIWP